jgi:hypothetical protein
MAGALLGNISAMGIVSVTVDLGSVAANTTEEETFTVQGLQVGDLVLCQKPTVSAGIGVCSARVSAANTVSVTIVNSSGGAVDAGSETWLVAWFRPETSPGSSAHY